MIQKAISSPHRMWRRAYFSPAKTRQLYRYKSGVWRGRGEVPIDKIAEGAESYKPKEKVTYKMIQEYIEKKYGIAYV